MKLDELTRGLSAGSRCTWEEVWNIDMKGPQVRRNKPDIKKRTSWDLGRPEEGGPKDQEKKC